MYKHLQLLSWILSFHFCWAQTATPSPTAPPLSCVPGNTSHDVDGTISGEIRSPGFPDPYPHNQDCSWLIKVPLGNLIRVTILDFDLIADDVLVLADGDRAYNVDIGRYSRCIKGEISLFSTGNSMLIRFQTDAKGSSTGFLLKYKAVRRSILADAGTVGACLEETLMGGTSGFIGYTGFPNPIPQNRRCVWTVTVPKGKKVLFRFQWMGMSEKKFMFCVMDWVQMSLTGQSGSVMYCGCDMPPNRMSNDNRGYVQFTSRKSLFSAGFLIEYRAVDDSDCPGGNVKSCVIKDNKIGVNRFGKVMYVPDKIPPTTPPATTEPPTTEKHDPFHVRCDKDYMEVVLDVNQFPGLDYKSAHLNEQKCQTTSANANQIRLRTPLDGCGTKHNYSSDGVYIIYHNNIIMNKLTSRGKYDVITRDHQAYFAFNCKFHRRMLLTVVHFSPSFTAVATDKAFGYGNFSYHMQMFKTSKYQETHDKYPVFIRSNEPVYLQLSVIANDSHLVLFVDTCYASPTSDPQDKQKYTFLEEGCARDETLEYKYSLSSVQRFSLKAFYFETFRRDEVHLHCKVLVCQRSDKDSRCAKGCPYGKRRRRETGIEFQTMQRLSIGPLKRRTVEEDGEDAQIERSAREEGRTFIVEIIAGSLAFVVMCLLVITLYFILVKPQRDRRGQVLLVKDSK